MRLLKACSSAFRRFLRTGSTFEPPKGGTTNLFIRTILLTALLACLPSTKASQPAAPKHGEGGTQQTAPGAKRNDNFRRKIESPGLDSKSEIFLMAQAAYDDGRYAEAASLYGQVTSNGVDNVELHYNLANAHFKNSSLSEAVLHYRKAWYKAPRDPDIRANLHFALNAAGAAEPTPSFLERLFNLLSQNGWIVAATGGYIVFSLLLILGMLLRPAKRTLARLSLLPALFILLTTGGWWHWQQLKTNPEWVVIQSDATALFGPIEGTTAHYKVPLAALVRQRGTDTKGWIEIEYDGKKGWLKKEYIKRVYP